MAPETDSGRMGKNTAGAARVTSLRAHVTAIDGHAAARSTLRPRDGKGRRVALAGTSATIVEALAVALNTARDVKVTGLARDEAELCQMLASQPPEVLVMYVPELDTETVEWVVRLKRAEPRLRVVLVASRSDVHMLVKAAAAGVGACLGVDTGLRQLIAAIQADTTGAMLVGTSSLVADGVRSDESRTGPKTPISLTRREREVVELLAEGCNPAAIAVRLVISIYTAQGHVKNVLRKLGAHSQLEAVAIAARMGLLAAGDRADPAVRGGE